MWETTYAKLCAYGRKMKLLKAEGCCLPPAGGNVKQTAMIVEVQWMVFWTRVRFPPAPLFSDYRSQNFCFCVISVRVQLVKIFQSFRTFLKIWPRPLSRPNRLTSYIYRYLSTSVLSYIYLAKWLFHLMPFRVILKRNGGGDYGKT